MTNVSAYRAMANAAAAETATLIGPVQACTSQEHDEQFLLRDKHTGMPLANVRYRIKGPGLLVNGRTDSEGRTARVATGARARRLQVYLLHDAADLNGSTQDWEGCV